MSAAPKIADPQVRSAAPKPQVNPWVIAGTVSLAAFMEVLDTSIANVALPHMAGDWARALTTRAPGCSLRIWSQRHYPADQRMAREPVRAQALLHAVPGRLHAEFVLCGVAPILGAYFLSRHCKGLGGGGLQPVSPRRYCRHLSAATAGMAFALYGIVA